MKKEDAQMIDGATRLFGIVGDPIAHVKAPTTLTRLFAARGINAVMVPIQVSAAGFDAFMAGVKATLNLDGLMVADFVTAHMARSVRDSRGGMMGSAGQTAVRWGTTSGAPSAPFTRSG